MPLPHLRTLTARAPRMPSRIYTRVAAAQRAGFGSSSGRLVGKESSLHDEGRAEEIVEHKDDQLRKQKEGKGHWKSELASDSEESVKADRGEIEASEDTIKKLQQETTEYMAEREGTENTVKRDRT